MHAISCMTSRKQENFINEEIETVERAITEAKNEKIKSLEIIKNISKDLEILNKDVELIKQEADKSNDYLTSTLMDNYIEDYSKRIWMLNETIK